MTYVLDASAAYLACRSDHDEPGADAVRRLLRETDEPVLAPTFLGYELAHLVFRKYRDRVDGVEHRVRLHRDLLDLATMREPDWSRVAAVAAEHGLTGYDAAYLELAEREGAVLVTNDAGLHRAAVRHLGAGGGVLLRREASLRRA